jgi:choline-sulfatase
VPNPANEALYSACDRLGRYGFSGWIGPEPHGPEPLNSGSSVPPGQQGRDMGFAQQAKSLIEQLDRGGGAEPWLIMASFVNPHDITLWGLWANLSVNVDFVIEPGVVPLDLFDQSLFQQTVNDNLANKPSAQASYQLSYNDWMQPIINNPVTLQHYYQYYYYRLHKNVDEQMMVVY